MEFKFNISTNTLWVDNHLVLEEDGIWMLDLTILEAYTFVFYVFIKKGKFRLNNREERDHINRVEVFLREKKAK